jgi:hypothetical protein
MLDPRPGAPVVSNPPVSDVHQRWKNDRDFIAAQDPWMHSPEKTVFVKQPDGTVVSRARTSADGAPSEPAPGEPRPGEPQLAPRDSSGRIQLTKDIAVTEAELHDLIAHRAATEAARLSTPQPGEYKLEFPHDYVLPAGIEGWKWDENNPLLGAVREFASASGMSQDTFSRLLGLHAASRMAEIQEFNTAKAAEVQKLGDNANARVDAVRAWMKSVVPEHFNDLARVLEMAPTASTVKALEVLAHRWVNQGGGAFNGAHREPTIPGKISDAEYGKLSYSERIAYAARFPQPGG